MSERVQVVVPGDDPVQIAGSPHLERLRAHGQVVIYDTTPADSAEKIERVRDAQVIINSRGVVTWREELRSLPNLKMPVHRLVATCGAQIASGAGLGVLVAPLARHGWP